ncbi:MAG: hypothetical protein Sapg2KO_24630 [Saprospiraceae bacterium]
MNKSIPTTYEIIWDEIQVSVLHKPNYISDYDHIEVRADERIPITETGYRSIFILPEEIEENGGVVELVTYLLNEEAQSSEWESHLDTSRQGSLF